MKNKEEVISKIYQLLDGHQIQVASIDDNRPWGGFFVISEKSTANFINLFFPNQLPSLSSSTTISPKILFVAPQKKLSLQYHHRRSELWRLIDGEAAISKSTTDEEMPPQKMLLNAFVRLEQGERHRLIGLESWGVVAEIWIHTNPANPSDENDIIRLQDDFGRS